MVCLDFERGDGGVTVTNDAARLLLEGSPAQERSWSRCAAAFPPVGIEGGG